MAYELLSNPQTLKRIQKEFLSALNNNPSVFTQQAYKSLNLFFTNHPSLCLITDQYRNDEQIVTLPPHGDFLQKILVNPYMTYTTVPPTAINNLVNNAQQLTICNSMCASQDLTQLRFIGSDPFSNETIISYCLADLLPPNFPTLALTQFAFICHNNGYRYYSNKGTPLSDLGRNDQLEFLINNNNIDGEFLFDIFNQVLLTLDYLQSSYSFIHGNLTTENILISSLPINYSSHSLAFSASFTCSITNFSSAAITIPLTVTGGVTRAHYPEIPHRIYSLGDDPRMTQILWWTIFNPQIQVYQDEFYYMIENTTVSTVLAQLRHMGIPFYLSYDVYTFIISLLLLKPIFSTFFSDPFYSDLWRLMWFDNDDEIMFEKLATFHQLNQVSTYNTIVSMLMNVKLKCKLTSTIIRYLQGR